MSALIKRLGSRKFLTAAAGLIFGVSLAFGGNEDVIRTVSGAVTTIASVLTYIITEGRLDGGKKE